MYFPKWLCIVFENIPNQCQHMLFLVLTNLVCMKWYIVSVLICISVSISEVEHLFRTLLAIQVFSSVASFSVVLFIFCYVPLLLVGVFKIYV